MISEAVLMVDNDPVSIGMSILSGYVVGYVAGRGLVLLSVPFADILENLRENCKWGSEGRDFKSHRPDQLSTTCSCAVRTSPRA